MKVFNFNTYDDFLERFDGEIFGIVDKEDGNLFCDIHENDLVRFFDEGKINGNGGCDFYLQDEKFRQEILSEEIIINIRNK